VHVLWLHQPLHAYILAESTADATPQCMAHLMLYRGSLTRRHKDVVVSAAITHPGKSRR